MFYLSTSSYIEQKQDSVCLCCPQPDRSPLSFKIIYTNILLFLFDCIGILWFWNQHNNGVYDFEWLSGSNWF